MSKLRELARGQPCMVRIPNVCCHDNNTTVLAHLRLSGITGAGQKAPDQLGAYACHECHRCVDSHGQTHGLDPGWVTELFYEGIFRTQYELIKKGIIKS